MRKCHFVLLSYIFILKLLGQGLDLELLPLLITKGAIWIVGRSHPWRFFLILKQIISDLIWYITDSLQKWGETIPAQKHNQYLFRHKAARDTSSPPPPSAVPTSCKVITEEKLDYLCVHRMKMRRTRRHLSALTFNSLLHPGTSISSDLPSITRSHRAELHVAFPSVVMVGWVTGLLLGKQGGRTQVAARNEFLKKLQSFSTSLKWTGRMRFVLDRPNGQFQPRQSTEGQGTFHPLLSNDKSTQTLPRAIK